MVRAITLASGGAFFIIVAAAHAELQLRPTIAEYKADGAIFKHLEFSDGSKTVTYQSPLGWDVSGNPTQLTLHPPNKAQTDATITRFPLSEPGCFDEASLKKLLTDTVAQVPKGSENVSVVSQKKNLLMIQGKETFLIMLSYTFYGQEYGRSILFLNRGNEQIRFQLTCHKADFNELHAVFFRSQFTWKNL